MIVNPVIQNYKQRTSDKNNQPAFGVAKIILKDENLLWSTALKYGHKEKYAEPFKKLFKNLKEVQSLKKAIKESPNNVELDASVSNFSPGAFYIGLSRAGSEVYESRYVVVPKDIVVENIKIKSTTINSLEAIGSRLARDIESLTRV